MCRDDAQELNKTETEFCAEMADASSTERAEEADIRERFNESVVNEEMDDSISRAKLAFERGSFDDLR